MSENDLGWVFFGMMCVFCGAQWFYAKWLEAAMKRGWDREKGYGEMIDQYSKLLEEVRARSERG